MGAQSDGHTAAKPLQCSDCYIRERLSNRIFAAPHIPLLFLTLLATTGNDIQIRLRVHWMLLCYSLRRGGQVGRKCRCAPPRCATRKGAFTVTGESMRDVVWLPDLAFALAGKWNVVLFPKETKKLAENYFFFCSTFKSGCNWRPDYTLIALSYYSKGS